MKQDESKSRSDTCNRLEISIDGSHACALWGKDLHDGQAVFVEVVGWPNATHKQEQAAMREAYELLCKAIGDRLPFDIVREHATPSAILSERGAWKPMIQGVLMTLVDPGEYLYAFLPNGDKVCMQVPPLPAER